MGRRGGETRPCIDEEAGAELLDSEPGFWIFRDKKTGRVIGGMVLHGDDMMIAGDLGNPEYVEARQAVHDSLEWTPWESGSFVQCGVRLTQTSEGIRLDQDDFSVSVEPTPVKYHRPQDDQLKPWELRAFRGKLGVVSWRAQQSAPWLCAEVSLLQGEVGEHTTAAT